jgi:hypothetical protein
VGSEMCIRDRRGHVTDKERDEIEQILQEEKKS